MARQRRGEAFKTKIRVIDTRLGESECAALVDTGADVNIVTLAAARRYGWSMKKVERRGPEWLVGFAGSDGGEVQVLGVVAVRFELDEATYKGKFYVADISREPPILIGGEFLDENKVSIVWHRSG